jgi:hypothetical protein
MNPEKVDGDGDGVGDTDGEADLVAEGLIDSEVEIAGVEVGLALATGVEEAGCLIT